MAVLKIVAMSMLAAIVYGIIHDQITARICVEYFTTGHPRLIDSESPTVLGFFWGTVATWWVGLPLGVGLAIAARAGRRPKLAAGSLVRPLIQLCLAMFYLAAIAGAISFFTSTAGIFQLGGRLASEVPEDRHIAFLTCGWAHSASYLSAILGGACLWLLTWRRRGRSSPPI